MILAGKGAVVTGGGRGIGAAAARALADVGARVVVAARTEAEIGRVAAALTASGHDVIAVPVDVTDPASVMSLAEVANRHLDTVDVVVNNAGIGISAPVAKISVDDWTRQLAVNLTGTFLVTQAFLPAMRERGFGRVVNVASIASRTGAPYIAAYTASKHGVLGFTRSVAAELRGTGVTINAVCPGYVDTPMTATTIENISRTTGRSIEEARQAILDQTADGRLIPPDEVAFVIRMLCDPHAASINGEAITMDGGGLLA
jgi:NAD(P)-dependent dehydrogenase (short-subunit alcohol dehydrogenase family)